jgi:hypothetical protein
MNNLVMVGGWSANLPESSGLGTGLDADAIINRRTDSLFAAQIALGRLNRDMTQKELDLLQLASRSMAESSTRPTQIMGR